MRKTIKPVLSVLMVLVIALASAPPVYAAGTQAPKQEVVYALLADDGSTQAVYVVNKFTVAQAGTITDFGNYATVRNMTDNSELASEAGQVCFEAPAGQFYYEGVLDGAQLPWLLRFRYTLDGQELQAQELAGKSGALRIDIDIAKNPKAEQRFFDEYALQLTVLLDTGRCQNIVASGATAALVGSDSQMTYTVLPGSEKSISITADVQDFEMEPISINGVRLALDVDIDDEELLGQILELMDGVAELDDGANALSDGADELAQGVADLQSGVATMQDGLNTLNGQSATLTSGSAQMKAGMEALGAALNGMSLTAEDLSALVAASAQIKTAIEGLATGTANLQAALSYDAYKAVMAQNNVDIAALTAGNATAAQGISDSIPLLTGMRDALPDDNPQKARLTTLIDQLTQASGLLGANNGVLSGLEGYFGGLYTSADPLVQGAANLNTQYAAFDATIQQMVTALGSLPQMMQQLKDSVQTLVDEYAKLDSGIGAYTNGVASLVAGYTQLSDGVNALATGCADLQAGVAELAEGTGTMREETSGMDETISERIDEILQDITGDENSEAISFVSPQNTGIKSVQFVMRTSGITVNEPDEPVMDEPENLSVWDRFINLFTKTTFAFTRAAE